MKRLCALLLVFATTADAERRPVPPLGPATQKPGVLVCHRQIQGTSIVTRLDEKMVANHVSHGDCRVPVNVSTVAGATCVRSDPDGDQICGVTCGDGAGPRGMDDACNCGDTVITDTAIDATHPVTIQACAAGALILAAGVQLELGGETLTGAGTGDGILVPEGGSVLDGSVIGFGVGIRVADGPTATATVLDGLLVEGNTDDGVLVELSNPASRAALQTLSVQGNGGDGVHVRGAPGASNLDDANDRQTSSGYGVVLQSNLVRDNLGHGIHIGDAAQVADASVFLHMLDVTGNGGVGVLLEQKAGLAPGADCGSSAGQPGCSGMTLLDSQIHSNASAGLELRSGFILPLFVPAQVDLGLGLVANQIYGNALASQSCVAAQSAPQVRVAGPVGLGGGTCATAATEQLCADANLPINQHCLWTGSACVVSWDLRGDVEAGCSNALSNSIHGYNTTDASEQSVGMRAEGGARVWADHNVWRSFSSGQNVSQQAGSIVAAEATCGTQTNCVLP